MGLFQIETALMNVRWGLVFIQCGNTPFFKNWIKVTDNGTIFTLIMDVLA